MLEDPQIIELAARPIAVLHVQVARDQIRSVMGKAYRELTDGVLDQDVRIVGPWFTHHFQRPTDIFDFEVGVPVERPIKQLGEVTPSEWPTLRAATALLHGPVTGLPAAWQQLHEWIAANGYSAEEDLWEQYTVGYEATRDPAGFRTHLFQPLR